MIKRKSTLPTILFKQPLSNRTIHEPMPPIAQFTERPNHSCTGSIILTPILKKAPSVFSRKSLQFTGKRLIKEKSQKIIIKILSKWGNGDLIECCEIDAINESMQTVSIESIHLFPEEQNKPDDTIKNLINQRLSKEDSWKSEFQKNMCLTCSIPSIEKITYIRFLSYGENTIKTVEIWKNGILSFKGNINQVLGSLIKLEPEKYDLKRRKSEIFNESKYHQFDCDKYGYLPQIFTKCVKITLLTNYISRYLENEANIGCKMDGSINKNVFGLTEIQLKDGLNNIIDDNQIDSVHLLDCSSYESANEMTKSFLPQFLRTSWCVLKSSQRPPVLKIEFKEEIAVSEIKIVNLFCAEYLPEHGVSNVKIEFDDDNVVYVGKLKHDLKRKNYQKSISFIKTNCCRTIEAIPVEPDVSVDPSE